MHLWKNSEIKKITIIFFFIFLLSLASTFITANIIIDNYKTYFLNFNARILTVITSKYPDMDQAVIEEILNNKPVTTAELDQLNKYGITKSDLMSSVESVKSQYHNVLSINLTLVIGLFIISMAVIFIFLIKLYKKINNLSDYTLKVMSGEGNISIIDNNEGEISLLKNRLYDITRILKENNELLEKDKSTLKTAIADISHQLKTPLTSLYLCNEILSDEDDSHQRALFLQKMHQELERIEWLISSLLKISKLDSKTVVLKNESINVSSLIDNTLNSLSDMITSKRIVMNQNGNKDVYFYGDFNWMKEAISNIIKNSIEHTDEQGKIEISYSDNPLYVEIKITDNGSGISSTDLPYIFDRFYRAKGSSKDSVGIGLALSKSIINSLNGDISVKSKENEYTSFTIKMYKY